MRRGMVYGLFLWAILTFIFKLLVDGDLIALSASTLQILLPIGGAGLAIVIAVAMRVLYPPFDATRIGMGLATSGMILAAGALLLYGRFSARPLMEHGIVYALSMLWTYGLILLAIALFCDEGAR